MAIELPKYGWLPTSKERVKIAEEVGRLLLTGLQGEKPTAQSLANVLEWGWAEDPFDKSAHEVQALLIPMTTGRFFLDINGDLNPSPQQTLWLAGHEIGHSLFWTTANAPQRPRRIFRHQRIEERFCDEFSNDLIKVLGGVALEDVD